MSSKNKPWRVLNVDKNATPDEIKRAYYLLAKERHPDKGGCTEKMAELNIAYRALLANLSEQMTSAISNKHTSLNNVFTVAGALAATSAFLLAPSDSMRNIFCVGAIIWGCLSAISYATSPK